MICRIEHHSKDGMKRWLLINQISHARLAGELAEAWDGQSQLPSLPMQKHLLPAIFSHDEGWDKWDKRPSLNEENGAPRSFLEMPMSVSTQLWSQSIAYCSGLRKENVDASLRKFQKFLTRSGRRLTPQRAFVVEEIFSMVQPFDIDALAKKLVIRSERESQSRSTLSRSTLFRLLGLLEAADMLKKLNQSHGVTWYHPPGVERMTTPFGGMWVCMFFCHLAQKAIEHRESKDDLFAIELFLNDQFKYQNLLQKTIAEKFPETLKQFARQGIIDWKKEGLEWLQFFDRLSLWFCCKQETETFHLKIPGEGEEQLHLTPLASGDIAVAPFPFEGENLKLSVPAKSIVVQPFSSDAEYLDILDSETHHVKMNWSLVKW